MVKAKKEVDKILEPIRATWPSSGVSIVFDGWTDPARHPLINFMVFPKWIDVLESGGCSWEIQGCTFYG